MLNKTNNILQGRSAAAQLSSDQLIYLSNSRTIVGGQRIRKKHCNEANKSDHVRAWAAELANFPCFDNSRVSLREPNWQIINRKSPEGLHDVLGDQGIVHAIIMVDLHVGHSFPRQIGMPRPLRRIIFIITRRRKSALSSSGGRISWRAQTRCWRATRWSKSRTSSSRYAHLARRCAKKNTGRTLQQCGSALSFSISNDVWCCHPYWCSCKFKCDARRLQKAIPRLAGLEWGTIFFAWLRLENLEYVLITRNFLGKKSSCSRSPLRRRAWSDCRATVSQRPWCWKGSKYIKIIFYIYLLGISTSSKFIFLCSIITLLIIFRRSILIPDGLIRTSKSSYTLFGLGAAQMQIIWQFFSHFF